MMNNGLSARPAWWQWPTVLSLDAPAVAMVWQALFARVLETPLRMHHHLLLGTVTWVVYAADRWLEGLEIEPACVCTHRHRFYQQYRRQVAGMIGLLTMASTGLAIARLTPAEWWMGLGFSVPVVMYLLVGPILRRMGAWRLPKEVLIALLFAAGTACFPLAGAGAHRMRLAGPMLWYAWLCLANLVLIARWERDVDAVHAHASVALAHPQLDGLIRAAPWTVALSAGFAGALGVGGPVAVTFCVSSGGFLLGLLDLAEPRLGRQLSRALVDFTLLTPLVPLLAG